MPHYSLNDSDEERLTYSFGPVIAPKLIAIGQRQEKLRHILEDYLWNESMCVRIFRNLSKERVVEFNELCQIIQLNTVDELVRVLDGYEEDLKNKKGSNENREYILKRFGLWNGR